MLESYEAAAFRVVAARRLVGGVLAAGVMSVNAS